MKEIILTNEGITRVSDIDYNYVNQFCWYLDNTGYVRHKDRNKESGIITMLHQIVIERKGLIVPVDMKIDHKDRNKLNNQRENLRIVTHSINIHNSKLRSDNLTGIKGVYFYSRINKYKVQINVNGNRIYLGQYDSFEEAVAARLKAEQKYKRFINPD